MKPVVLFAVLAVLIVFKEPIKDVLFPPEDLSYLDADSVVLLSTSWCRYCEKTRRLFNRHGVGYREYDIEQDAYGKLQYDKLNGGGVPIVKIGSDVVRGYNPDQILSLLKAMPEKTTSLAKP